MDSTSYETPCIHKYVRRSYEIFSARTTIFYFVKLSRLLLIRFNTIAEQSRLITADSNVKGINSDEHVQSTFTAKAIESRSDINRNF